jgi:large subunit ribosomal protein L3
MSETQEGQSSEKTVTSSSLKLDAGFAFKVGMTQVYDEQDRVVPVTVLQWKPWFVTQIKTEQSDGYSALQIACNPKKSKNASKAELGHSKKASLSTGFQFVREVRVAAPEGIQLGQEVALESFVKGDVVKLTSVSKGKGFQGSVKRWNFGGGPAAHGSKFHRQPGSSGNRTWPGRVMPGKKFPGHLGDETVSVRNIQVVDVLIEEGVLLVKGPVPGARNTLVRIVKQK